MKTKKDDLKPPPVESYTLELSAEHLQVINSALELFFRCGMGQYDHILDLPDHWDKRNDLAAEVLDQLHVILTKKAPNAYSSITSSEISDSYRVANDIYQVIRHKLSWDKNPKGGMTVNYDTPMKWGKSPLIKIDKKLK